MKNLADDIIDMLNFIRPYNDPIKRDKVFTSEKNYMMKFKEGGKDYLKKCQMVLIFLELICHIHLLIELIKEKLPNGLLFTPVIKCMERFSTKSL